MTRRSLERRLAALESARPPDDGMYVVDIGEPDVDDGERVQLDAWPRQYAGVVVDIGGSTNDDENRAT
jgi:CHASE2 domain-containing sensor protein